MSTFIEEEYGSEMDQPINDECIGLELCKTNQGDYFAIDLGEAGQTQICCLKNWRRGELGDPFCWSPSPVDIPNPQITWLKPVSQRAILDRLDLMVKITKMNRGAVHQGKLPPCGVWERGGAELVEFKKADNAWITALRERFWAYFLLGLERPDERQLCSCLVLYEN